LWRGVIAECFGMGLFLVISRNVNALHISLHACLAPKEALTPRVALPFFLTSFYVGGFYVSPAPLPPPPLPTCAGASS
jgi:hypothetical protein